jgi:hypothetical protein
MIAERGDAAQGEGDGRGRRGGAVLLFRPRVAAGRGRGPRPGGRVLVLPLARRGDDLALLGDRHGLGRSRGVDLDLVVDRPFGDPRQLLDLRDLPAGDLGIGGLRDALREVRGVDRLDDLAHETAVLAGGEIGLAGLAILGEGQGVGIALLVRLLGARLDLAAGQRLHDGIGDIGRERRDVHDLAGLPAALLLAGGILGVPGGRRQDGQRRREEHRRPPRHDPSRRHGLPP